jgi:hypothetical protein
MADFNPELAGVEPAGAAQAQPVFDPESAGQSPEALGQEPPASERIKHYEAAYLDPNTPDGKLSEIEGELKKAHAERYQQGLGERIHEKTKDLSVGGVLKAGWEGTKALAGEAAQFALSTRGAGRRWQDNLEAKVEANRQAGKPVSAAYADALTAPVVGAVVGAVKTVGDVTANIEKGGASEIAAAMGKPDDAAQLQVDKVKVQRAYNKVANFFEQGYKDVGQESGYTTGEKVGELGAVAGMGELLPVAPVMKGVSKLSKAGGAILENIGAKELGAATKFTPPVAAAAGTIATALSPSVMHIPALVPTIIKASKNLFTEGMDILPAAAEATFGTAKKAWGAVTKAPKVLGEAIGETPIGTSVTKHIAENEGAIMQPLNDAYAQAKWAREVAEGDLKDAIEAAKTGQGTETGAERAFRVAKSQEADAKALADRVSAGIGIIKRADALGLGKGVRKLSEGLSAALQGAALGTAANIASGEQGRDINQDAAMGGLLTAFLHTVGAGAEKVEGVQPSVPSELRKTAEAKATNKFTAGNPDALGDAIKAEAEAAAQKTKIEFAQKQVAQGTATEAQKAMATQTLPTGEVVDAAGEKIAKWRVKPVDAGPRSPEVSTGTGVPTAKEQEILTDLRKQVDAKTGAPLDSGKAVVKTPDDDVLVTREQKAAYDDEIASREEKRKLIKDSLWDADTKARQMRRMSEESSKKVREILGKQTPKELAAAGTTKAGLPEWAPSGNYSQEQKDALASTLKRPLDPKGRAPASAADIPTLPQIRDAASKAIPIDSSNIKSAYYDPEKRWLQVEFVNPVRGDTWYHYAEVPQEDVAAWYHPKTESQGSFHGKRIRLERPYLRISGSIEAPEGAAVGGAKRAGAARKF